MTLYKFEDEIYGWDDSQIEAGTAKGEPLTEEELEAFHNKQDEQSKVAEAQQFLDSTDYCIVKCAEHGLDIDTEYPGLKEKREKARETTRNHKGALNAENS